MSKTYMGVRLRRLREDRGMTQAALARALEISPSYLNQIEQNARPLTVPVLLKLNAAFGLDVQMFSDADEARLIIDLRAALADQGAGISVAEVRELATNMPEVARSIIAMQRRLRETAERADQLAGHITAPPAIPPPRSRRCATGSTSAATMWPNLTLRPRRSATPCRRGAWLRD